LSYMTLDFDNAPLSFERCRRFQMRKAIKAMTIVPPMDPAAMRRCRLVGDIPLVF